MTAPTRRDDAVSTPNAATSTRPERSSARVARKAPLGWLPWLLLGLLAVLLALVLLVINAIDDDGPDGAAGDSLGQVGASGGSGANGADDSGAEGAATGGTDGATTEGGTGGGAGQAALTAGGQDLLAVPGGSVGSLTGQSATGRGVVESVVADEGFWAGSSATDRVFVFLTPEARRSAGESGFQVRQGQTVQLQGTVARSDAGFADRVGVEASEGRQQLLDQGGYVEATEVALAQ